jgi:hypothetical protein
VLKVYPDDLHWKMQKEVTVIGLIADRLGVPAKFCSPTTQSGRSGLTSS